MQHASLGHNRTRSNVPKHLQTLPPSLALLLPLHLSLSLVLTAIVTVHLPPATHHSPTPSPSTPCPLPLALSLSPSPTFPFPLLPLRLASSLRALRVALFAAMSHLPFSIFAFAHLSGRHSSTTYCLPPFPHPFSPYCRPHLPLLTTSNPPFLYPCHHLCLPPVYHGCTIYHLPVARAPVSRQRRVTAPSLHA